MYNNACPLAAAAAAAVQASCEIIYFPSAILRAVAAARTAARATHAALHCHLRALLVTIKSVGERARIIYVDSAHVKSCTHIYIMRGSIPIV